MMIFEIATPYDSQESADCYETLASLFTALAAMSGVDGDPATTQYEIEVMRWASWEEREAHNHDREFEPLVVLDLDQMTS
jgi:hypothetical protein